MAETEKALTEDEMGAVELDALAKHDEDNNDLINFYAGRIDDTDYKRLRSIPVLLSMARRTLAAEKEAERLKTEIACMLLRVQLQQAMLRNDQSEWGGLTDDDALGQEAELPAETQARLQAFWEELEKLPGLVNPGYPLLENLYHAALNENAQTINTMRQIRDEIEALRAENARLKRENNLWVPTPGMGGTYPPSMTQAMTRTGNSERCTCDHWAVDKFEFEINPACPVHGAEAEL